MSKLIWGWSRAACSSLQPPFPFYMHCEMAQDECYMPALQVQYPQRKWTGLTKRGKPAKEEPDSSTRYLCAKKKSNRQTSGLSNTFISLGSIMCSLPFDIALIPFVSLVPFHPVQILSVQVRGVEFVLDGIVL